MNSLNNNVLDQNGTTTSTETNSVKSVCCGIYGLRCRTTNKWYIGQSWDINRRMRDYKKVKCNRQFKLFNALVKYGIDDFEISVLEILRCPSQIALDRMETFWISKCNSVEDGYNLKSGGANGKHSEDTKSRMRKPKDSIRTEAQRENMASAQRGKKQSKETVEKRASKMRGKKRPLRTTEWSNRISENAKRRYQDKTTHPSYGKHCSEETKQKIRDTLMRRKLMLP